VRAPCLVTDVCIQSATHAGERLRKRIDWLARTGGYLIAPTIDGTSMSVPGIRHIVPEVPTGADPEVRGAIVSDCVRGHVASKKPLFVHCLGMRAAVGALLGSRNQPPVIIEPGATPAQVLRDQNPEWVPERLMDLVELEDRVLARAHAVIARSSVEAATLVKRGVHSDRVWMASDGLPSISIDARLSDLPILATVIASRSALDISVLAAALERLKHTWRLLILYDPDVSSRIEIMSQFGTYLMSRIDIEALTERSLQRLATVRVMVSGVRLGRALRGGGFVPDSVLWGLASGRPLVVPDVPAIRTHVGYGGEYYAIDDPGHLAQQIDSLLSDRAASEDLRLRCESQAERLTWAQSEELVTSLWGAIANEMTDI
jgi:hypothetical protein